jgi:NADPH:quinone reductase-like Zn-dependent oxidoreductase
VKAIVYTEYGPPEALALREVPKPEPKEDEILVKIEAVSLNRSDWEMLIGKPLYARIGGLRRPGRQILGSDIAGRVVAAGSRHTRFRPGDEVFGDILGRMGGLAEYVAVQGKVMAAKPPSLSFEQASTLPQAGVIALEGIQTKGRVQRGQQVLINGGGGGTGVFAIQLAKLHGAEVTAVDNAGKLEFMRSIGADRVLDYARVDFTRGQEKYDLILDLVAHRSAFAYARALKPGGTYYIVGGSMTTLFQVLLAGPFIRRRTGKHVRLLAVNASRENLEAVTALCLEGKLRPVIDRRFRLSEAPEALRYLGEGRAKGKVIVSVD